MNSVQPSHGITLGERERAACKNAGTKKYFCVTLSKIFNLWRKCTFADHL
jgi:hypothetical protein